MRKPLKTIALVVLATALAVFLVALACSWDIIMKGEINTEESKPDSIENPVPKPICGGDFIEMEVGELEQDTVPPSDTLPYPEGN